MPPLACLSWASRFFRAAVSHRICQQGERGFAKVSSQTVLMKGEKIETCKAVVEEGNHFGNTLRALGQR